MHSPCRCLATLLLAGLVLAGCGGSVQLFSNMAERDANDVLSALSEAGISARKLPGKEGAVNLEVDQSSVAKAVAHLNAEGLPREHRSSMGDVFRKEGLISSPLEERARYLWALSQELSETIAQIDGVVRARVHVVLPERSSGGDPPLPSSAAVFVKHRRALNVDDATPQIRRLVASSIPGLHPDKVSIVMVLSASRGGTPAPVPAQAVAAAPITLAAASAPARAVTAPGGQGFPEWMAVGAAGAAGTLALSGFAFWRIRRTSKPTVQVAGNQVAGNQVVSTTEPAI
jgi:type III secretion protein J